MAKKTPPMPPTSLPKAPATPKMTRTRIKKYALPKPTNASGNDPSANAPANPDVPDAGSLPGGGYSKGGKIPLANHPHYHAMKSKKKK